MYDEKGYVIGIITPNPPESFFLEEGGAGYEPLQYVTKSTRFKNLFRKLIRFKPGSKPPADPKAAAHAAAILVEVKRK